MPTELLRPATLEDLPAVAEVHLAARQAAVKAMPSSRHSADSVRAWVTGWDLAADDVWVAARDEEIVGYSRGTTTWLDDLYVAPSAQRRGIGSALLKVVKAQRPGGFGVWAFESNAPARAFYARHGLVELERTDGSANEERAPDIKLVWPGEEPLAYFRSLIDDVDLGLGDLLAQRVALTRAVQDHKRGASAVTDLARDAEREADIVRRVAGVATELGEERVARIMHTVISESLDTWRT